MTKEFINVRGMRDLFDKDLKIKYLIENTARELATSYGYQEISTPIIEYTSVFNKTLGESSDVVLKEMYTFEDEKGRSLTLRPEATAGIARAVVSNGLLGSGEYRIPLKLFLFGPMFRYERPQKGRYRQFNQVNFETFGNSIPEFDFELISLAYNFLKKLNLPTNLVLNSLGDLESRTNYKKELLPFLNKNKDNLSEDSKKRINTNPLRILDSKNKIDIEIIRNAPKMNNYLSQKSMDYYETVKKLLVDNNIQFKEDKNLVRGLDYYKETVFEFKTDKLGNQQDTILGGGRYSGLIKMFGGDNIDGVGWAGGVDRLIEIYNDKKLDPKIITTVFDDEYDQEAYRLVNLLRSSNSNQYIFEIYYDVKKDKQVKRANKIKSDFIIYIENKDEVKIYNKKNNNKSTISDYTTNKIFKILNGN